MSKSKHLNGERARVLRDEEVAEVADEGEAAVQGEHAIESPGAAPRRQLGKNVRLQTAGGDQHYEGRHQSHVAHHHHWLNILQQCRLHMRTNVGYRSVGAVTFQKFRSAQAVILGEIINLT